MGIGDLAESQSIFLSYVYQLNILNNLTKIINEFKIKYLLE